MVNILFFEELKFIFIFKNNCEVYLKTDFTSNKNFLKHIVFNYKCI